MRILFIAGTEFLYKPRNGGQRIALRNYQMIQRIVGRENTYLITFSNYQYDSLSSNEFVFPTNKNLFDLLYNTFFFRNVCNLNTLKEVKRLVDNLEFDMVFVDRSTIGCLVRKLNIKKSIVVFFHNIERSYAWNKVKHEGLHFIIAYFSFLINEKHAVMIADKLILINFSDQAEMKRLYGKYGDFFLPASFTDGFNENELVIESRSNDKRLQLLFVGTFFQPNYEGIQWFVDEVMSELGDQCELKIVGENMELKKKKLEKYNVEVIGTVDDLAPYYYKADVIVIPIFYGDGMKVKTAEALMYGKAILATREALEGYDLKDVDEVIECNSKEEFIQAINKNRYGVENKKYYQRVRARFLEKYETSKMEMMLKDFLLKEQRI